MPPKRGTKGKRKGSLTSGAHTRSQGAPPSNLTTETTARDTGNNPDVMDDNQPAPTGSADVAVQENSAASAGGDTPNNKGSNVVPGNITA